MGPGRCLSLAAWPTPRGWPQRHLLFRGQGAEGTPTYCLVAPGSAGLRSTLAAVLSSEALWQKGWDVPRLNPTAGLQLQWNPTFKADTLTP